MADSAVCHSDSYMGGGQGSDTHEALEEMNRAFLDLERGEGFPLIEPTHAKVERMLIGGITSSRSWHPLGLAGGVCRAHSRR